MSINYTGGSKARYKPYTSRHSVDETGTKQHSVRAKTKYGRSLLVSTDRLRAVHPTTTTTTSGGGDGPNARSLTLGERRQRPVFDFKHVRRLSKAATEVNERQGSRGRTQVENTNERYKHRFTPAPPRPNRQVNVHHSKSVDIARSEMLRRLGKYSSRLPPRTVFQHEPFDDQLEREESEDLDSDKLDLRPDHGIQSTSSPGTDRVEGAPPIKRRKLRRTWSPTDFDVDKAFARAVANSGRTDERVSQEVEGELVENTVKQENEGVEEDERSSLSYAEAVRGSEPDIELDDESSERRQASNGGAQLGMDQPADAFAPSHQLDDRQIVDDPFFASLQKIDISTLTFNDMMSSQPSLVSWTCPFAISRLWRQSNTDAILVFSSKFECLDDVQVFSADDETVTKDDERRYLHERMGLGSKGLTRDEVRDANELGTRVDRWDKWWEWFGEEEVDQDREELRQDVEIVTREDKAGETERAQNEPVEVVLNNLTLSAIGRELPDSPPAVSINFDDNAIE
ncbi:hypothetical protein ACM66B_005599 [Microbotryomycetes sp. NB124-2]